MFRLLLSVCAPSRMLNAVKKLHMIKSQEDSATLYLKVINLTGLLILSV